MGQARAFVDVRDTKTFHKPILEGNITDEAYVEINQIITSSVTQYHCSFPLADMAGRRLPKQKYYST